MYCKICQEENCKKHSFFLPKKVSIDKFSGSTPPEIFVGKYNYPNVYTGILSPQEYGNTEILSSHELWHKNNLSIPQILDFRNKLIYARTKAHVKDSKDKLLPIMKEVAMAHAPISTEFKLKKPITAYKEKETFVPLITSSAQVDSVKLEENPKIKPKVEYLVNDIDAKSKTAILELEKAEISISSIIKLLSSGNLGLKTNRKLVPTRWSITAVDDLLSKEKLKKIKASKEIEDYQVFHSEFLGNHYEFLLIPNNFSFEVIEISLKKFGVWKDYESFNGRITYAKSVTGAYYANRLALTEYLSKINRQASCLVIRQISEEYYAPLGVGILRETSRAAFQKIPEKFNNLKEALESIQKRLKINISNFSERSDILNNLNKQTRLSRFF